MAVAALSDQYDPADERYQINPAQGMSTVWATGTPFDKRLVQAQTVNHGIEKTADNEAKDKKKK